MPHTSKSRHSFSIWKYTNFADLAKYFRFIDSKKKSNQSNKIFKYSAILCNFENSIENYLV